MNAIAKKVITASARTFTVSVVSCQILKAAINGLILEFFVCGFVFGPKFL